MNWKDVKIKLELEFVFTYYSRIDILNIKPVSETIKIENIDATLGDLVFSEFKLMTSIPDFKDVLEPNAHFLKMRERLKQYRSTLRLVAIAIRSIKPSQHDSLSHIGLRNEIFHNLVDPAYEEKISQLRVQQESSWHAVSDLFDTRGLNAGSGDLASAKK